MLIRPYLPCTVASYVHTVAELHVPRPTRQCQPPAFQLDGFTRFPTTTSPPHHPPRPSSSLAPQHLRTEACPHKPSHARSSPSSSVFPMPGRRHAPTNRPAGVPCDAKIPSLHGPCTQGHRAGHLGGLQAHCGGLSPSRGGPHRLLLQELWHKLGEGSWSPTPPPICDAGDQRALPTNRLP